MSVLNDARNAGKKKPDPATQDQGKDQSGTRAAPAPSDWPEPMAPEAFHGLPGQIVRTLEPHSEADPAALLVQLLVMFGNVINRSAHFTTESDEHFASEFAVMVGPTASGRKGTSFGRVRECMAKADSTWAESRIMSGLSSAEGLLWAIRDAVMTRERITQGRGQPPNFQEVESDPGVADKRLMIVEPEWANVLKQAERTGNTLSPILRQFWDCKHTIRTLTKNLPVKVTGGHVSIIGHITAEELRRYMSTTEVANGFGNRHLFVMVRRSKALPRGSQVPAAAMAQMQDAILAARNFAVDLASVGDGAVGFSPAAWSLWDNMYPHLTSERPGLAGALLGRGAPHVRRLAMIYALLDQSYQVEADHLAAAGAVWDYCEASVYHLFGNATGDFVADEIWQCLKAKLPGGLTRTEISNYFNRNVSSARISQALAMLERYGRARRQDELGPLGRTPEQWFAVIGTTNQTKNTNKAGT